MSWAEALAAAADGLEAARRAGGPEAVALIGGARSTNEGAYAWAKLAKAVLGTDSVDAQLGDGLPAELVLSLPRATLDEACAARVVVLLTGDVREELPVLFLRLRRAALDGGTAAGRAGPAPDLAHPLRRGLPRHPSRRRPAPGPGARRRRRRAPARRRTPRARPSTPRTWRRGRGPRSAARATGVVVVLGRPSLAEHEGVVAEAAAGTGRRPARRPLPAGPAPGQRDGRPRHGAGPRASCPGGSRCRRGPSGSTPAGVRCRRRAAGGAAEALASLAGEAAGGDEGRTRALIALGADVADDFSDRDLARRALGCRRLRGGRGRPSLGHHRARRRGPARRGGPRAAGHHHQRRGPGEPARARSWSPRARPGPTG